MPPRRGRRDLGEPLLIELDGESSDPAGEVSFGGRPQPSRRGWLLAGAAVLAAALVVAVVRRDDEEGAGGRTPTPTTTANVAAPTTDRPPDERTPTTQRDPAEILPNTVAATPAWDPLPAFATDPGWRVYLRPIEAGRAPLALDPTSGELSSDRRADASTAAVISTAGGQRFIDGGASRSTAVVADGSVWTLEQDGLVRRDGSPSGAAELERFGPLTAQLLAAYGGLIGTTGEGRPVILLPDARAYVVGLDGGLSRLAEGIVARVEGGQFAENGCDPTGVCALTFHGASGTSTVTELGGVYGAAAFDPTGRYVAFFAQLSSLGRGAVPSIAFYDLVEQRQIGVVDDAYNVSVISALRGWSPDGRYYFASVSTGLVAFEPASGRTLELTGLGDEYVVIGVA